MSMDEVNEAYSVGERAGRAAERAEIVAILRGHIASHKAHERKMSYHETGVSALTTVLRLVEARGKEQSDG